LLLAAWLALNESQSNRSQISAQQQQQQQQLMIGASGRAGGMQSSSMIQIASGVQ